MYNFFTPDETELKQVIHDTLKGQDQVVEAKTIQTGWTNITMDVTGEQDNYIFRFPRNLFFAQMMTKDCRFCQFVRDKVSVTTPDMHLMMNQNRPFSMHKKIKGVSLTSKMNHLTASEQKSVIDGVVHFLSELHSIPVSLMPTDIAESLNDFLTGLASVHKGNYDLGQHGPLISMEKDLKKPVIVHGDFNPGNILLDENCHVSGVIDFAFASVSDRSADIGRFVGRATPELGQALIEAYRETCDQNKIQNIVQLFKYVEYKYVQYMQSNHPEIVIPESVLQMAANEARHFNA